MALNREDLTSAWVERFTRRMREEGQFEPLSDAQRAASLERVLAQRGPEGDIWLFGYGSLMWNPIVHYVERRPGRIHGYHRAYCMWLRWGRATRREPGLMLGLDRGGSCRGMAYRVAAARAPEELVLIWRREMISGVYRPTWVTVHTPRGALRAVTFVVERSHPLYTGRLAVPEVARRLARAGGWLGSCREYLESTMAHLHEVGIHDRYLHAVQAEVRALDGRRARASSRSAGR